MRDLLARVLDSRLSVYAACLLTLALGLVFVFVWAPHPWGWAGIDYYHVLALELARGGEFLTTDVPWGYAYFVAFWYWLSGERLWVPLVAQVVANATVPLLLYRLVSPLAGSRTATLSALLVGVLSFNTVYASTEASDAVCTVLFMAALTCFARGCRSGRAVDFALAGLFSGLAPQFRPNLILLPAVGLSVLSGAHNVLVPAVLQALQARGLGDVPVFVGGIIPEEDAAALRAQGVSAVFGPGTSTSEIIRVMQSVAAARPPGS